MKGGLRIIKLGGIVLKDRSREELDFMRGEGAEKKSGGGIFCSKILKISINSTIATDCTIVFFFKENSIHFH